MKPRSITEASPAKQKALVAEDVEARKARRTEAIGTKPLDDRLKDGAAALADAAIVTPSEVKETLGLDEKKPRMPLRDRINQVARSYFQEET